MSPFSPEEQEILAAGNEWIDDHAETLIGLLEALVARPSISGTEGTYDDSSTVVGNLWSFLEDHGDALALDAQRIESDRSEARDNLFVVLEGDADGGLLSLSHTDIVPPGSSTAWPGDDPYTVSRGTVRRTNRREIVIEAGGESHRRTIRENLATVWDQRGIDEVDVLIGRGVYDNKACSICLVGCLLALDHALSQTEHTLAGDVIHGHLIDEEMGQLGVKHLCGWENHGDWLGDRYGKIDDFAGVILEGQYGFVPVVGHRGGINLTIQAEGEAVHGSTPELGRNAVLGMAKALAAMDDPAFIERVTGPFIDDELLGAFTIAPGTTIVGGGISSVEEATGEVTRGGGAEYAVSDWCQATVDCRIPRWSDFPERPAAIHDRFITLMHEAISEQAPDIDFTVDSNMFFLPVAMGEGRAQAARHPLVATAKDATEHVSGYRPEIAVAPGATDGWVLYHSTRMPTLVEYGPAGALSHEPLEFVERDQVIEGAKILLDMTIRHLGLAD